mgnify:CR=1 FL=1
MFVTNDLPVLPEHSSYATCPLQSSEKRTLIESSIKHKGYEMYIYIRLVLWMACVCVFSTAYNRDRLIKSSYLNVQPELSFGEDTELLHASVDLKWLSAALINKQTWRLMFCSILSKLKRFSASYDDIFTYQDIAAEIEYSIQELNTQISLR